MRNNRENYRKKVGILAALAIVLTAVLLGGCASWEERTWMRAPGWSRGTLLGVSEISDPVPLAIGTDGTVYVAIFIEENGVTHANMLALDEQADVIWERTYADEVSRPDAPLLLWDGSSLNLLWISDHSIFWRQFDSSGEPQGETMQISGEHRVGSYDAALSPRGDLTVWYAGTRSDPGVYALPSGDLEGPAALIDAEGVRPDIAFTRDGTLHAIWAQYPPGYGQTRFFYARHPEGGQEASYLTTLFEPLVSVSRTLEGPFLGLDEERAYLVWTIEVRTGTAAGQIDSFIIDFPTDGEAGIARASNLRVPSAYTLEYQDTDWGALNAGHRVILGESQYSTTGQITNFAFDPTQASELAAVFSANVDYLRRKDQWQIGALYFNEGDPEGYQLLSFTTAESTSPYLEVDTAGNLYLTWIEHQSAGGAKVYIATTRSETRDLLGGIRASDISQFVAESLFGMASGIVLIPAGLIWMAVGAVVVMVTGFMRRQDAPLSSPGTLISLSLAIAAFWGTKLFVFPNYFEYVPFSAWIPVIPEAWELPLRYGVPILTFFAGIGAALRFTYGRRERMPLFFVLIYGLVDSLITLALYGVIIWAAF